MVVVNGAAAVELMVTVLCGWGEAGRDGEAIVAKVVGVIEGEDAGGMES